MRRSISITGNDGACHFLWRLGRRRSPLVSLATLAVCLSSAADVRTQEKPSYTIELTTAHSGYDRKTCWVHARAGAISPRAAGNPSDNPLVVMTTQKLLLDRSDVFYGLHDLISADLGHTWSEPQSHATLERRRIDEHHEVVACDFTPRWHATSGKLLVTGLTAVYRDNQMMFPKERQTAYSVYDPGRRDWSEWATLAMPEIPQFRSSGAGCTQRYDLPNGDILLPIYFAKVFGAQVDRVVVVRCRFDGEKLTYVEHGEEMAVDSERGLAEPSLPPVGNRFYLTIRHDARAYVTADSDSLHFEPLREWKSDNGSELGNYNTQQHWVTHGDELYLVYNRHGADNDHIFRHRAPLFMAKVDPARLRVIRSTEQILVPQRGARLGNFGIVDVTPTEAWVIVTEWMQGKTSDPRDCEKYGSDNTIFVAKLNWREPNQLPGWPAASEATNVGQNQSDR